MRVFRSPILGLRTAPAPASAAFAVSRRPLSLSVLLFLLLAAGVWIPSVVEAQRVQPGASAVWLYPVPGSAAERYARTLENVGLRPARSLSVRDGGESWERRSGDRPGASAAIPVPPWNDTYRLGLANVSRSGLLPLQLGSSYNTAFPFQRGSGPVWHGRGFTHSLSGGAFGRWGVLSMVLNPIWFRSENRAFPLANNGLEADGRFRSPLSPNKLDQPQRFGDEPYSRFSMGNSAIRLQVVGIGLGLSTAPQKWGGGDLHPMVLGDAGGGVPHLYFGSARPFSIGIGRASVRYMAGRTLESGWYEHTGSEGRRLLNGFVLSFQPLGLPGLEVGATRLFHSAWPTQRGGLRTLLARPFEGFLKRSLEGVSERNDDQFASVFFRWVAPEDGFELFGEFLRVDHSWDARTGVLEPDDQSGYSLGFRKSWLASSGSISTLRGEAIVSGSGHRERGGARIPLAYRSRPPYWDDPVVGGLTHRGLFLASAAGPYANGQSLGFDRYQRNGRWSWDINRFVVRNPTLGAATEVSSGSDVLLIVNGEFVRFVGRWDVTVGAAWVRNLNRYLISDKTNVGLQFSLSRRFSALGS